MKSEEKTSNSVWMVKAYPFGVLLIGVILNFLFGIEPMQVSVPSKDILGLISLAGIMLAINHSWIMTATELARYKFKIFATPEEWTKSGRNKSDITDEGAFEIERHLNTHRNTTENTVYYTFLAATFAFATPNPIAAGLWILMFPLARLGYTYSYLTGNDNVRGAFMTLSLLSMYGMSSYLAFAFFFTN